MNQTTINDKGPGLQSKPFDKHTTNNDRKFNAKSTLTEAQYHRIILMLRTGEKSTLDFRRAGVMAPAARIKELNDQHGAYIPTIALRDLYDDEGYCHPRVAVYELIDEPKGRAAL